MEECLHSFKFDETDLALLEKFSNISGKIWLKPDKLEIIDGHVMCKKNTATTTLAYYKYKHPAYSFIDDIGLINLSEFLGIIKIFDNNYNIEVYSTYLNITDGFSSFYYPITSDIVETIPKCDFETNFDRTAKQTNRVILDLKQTELDKIFKIQKILKTNNVFFYQNEKGEIVFKIAETFKKGFKTTSDIKIDNANIIEKNLPCILPKASDGKQGVVLLELKQEILIPDSYTMEIREACIVLVGKKTKTKYIILTKKIKE